MKLTIIALLCLTIITTSLAIFPRSEDCFCTCGDGKACLKSIPNFLELRTVSCQCWNGTCPSGKEYNGKKSKVALFFQNNVACFFQEKYLATALPGPYLIFSVDYSILWTMLITHYTTRMALLNSVCSNNLFLSFW